MHEPGPTELPLVLVWFGLVFCDSLVASLPSPRLFEHNLKLFPQMLTEEPLNLTPVLPRVLIKVSLTALSLT